MEYGLATGVIVEWLLVELICELWSQRVISHDSTRPQNAATAEVEHGTSEIINTHAEGSINFLGPKAGDALGMFGLVGLVESLVGLLWPGGLLYLVVKPQWFP